MYNLPNELLIYLSAWLPKADLKSFRLCSRAHADAGQAELFRNFEFRLWPDQHRFYQLEQLAAHPEIVLHLKCLSFQSGILLEYADYRYWQAQVYKEASSRWTSSGAPCVTSKEEYEAFHTALQGRFLPNMQNKYNLYRWHHDQEGGQIAQVSTRKQLIHAMNALSQWCSSVELKMSMIEPQISLEDIERFDSSLYQHEKPEDPDPRRRVANRRQHTLNHFKNFLTAAHESNLNIRDLTMIDVPQQLFTGDGGFVAATLPDICDHLRHFSVKVSTLPHSDWLSRSGTEPIYQNGRNTSAQRLRKLIDCGTKLDSLRLEFPQDKEAEYSFDLFDRTNIHRFPRKCLPQLKQLELCHFQCTWEDLKALLEETHQLRRLTLAHGRLETYSMVDLIRTAPALRLESVSLIGEWYVDQDGGSWHAHTVDDFTHCSASTSYEGPYLFNGMRKNIEEYMVKGGHGCPLPEWAPIDGGDCPWELLGDTSWHFSRQRPFIHMTE